MRLRATLTAAMTGLGGLVVGVATALVVLTSALNDAGVRLSGSMERVRLLMELESLALQHVHQTADSGSETAGEIINRLRETAEPELQEDIRRLETRIRSVAAASTQAAREGEFEALIDALRRVVAREDDHARQATAAAASWNRLANIIGILTILVLILGVAGILRWLWQRALQPLVGVIEAIDRFAKGDPNARAAEDGPGEIREIAVAFNGMASSLGRQREQQLAFIGGVAHDLRTPLDALQVAVALFDREPCDRQRVRDRVRRQVERLEQMIGDLLDRTRIEAGRFELHLDGFDLRDIAARVVETRQESTPLRTFRLTLPDQPVAVRGDALRIEQVLNNLLSNAVKYSPELSEVAILLKIESSMAVLSVADQGIGIDVADPARIFEPFNRGGNIGSIDGAGLGLSVTRKIVDAHGGRIEVRSESGCGSVFSVWLPLARAEKLADVRDLVSK